MLPLSAIAASKYTKPIVIAVSIAVTILVIYLLGKSKGKKTNEYIDPPNETGWGGNLTPAESDKIKTLTERLFKDIDSWQVSAGWVARDCEAYTELSTTSDRITIGVANYYMQNYGSKLYSDIEGESFAATRGCSDDLKTAVLSKLLRLNLK